MLKLTQGQGFKVKGQGQICNFIKKNCRLYIMKNDWILMTLIHMVSYNVLLKSTQGQVHKVQGQGQLRFFLLNIGTTINHEPIILY